MIERATRCAVATGICGFAVKNIPDLMRQPRSFGLPFHLRRDFTRTAPKNGRRPLRTDGRVATHHTGAS